MLFNQQIRQIFSPKYVLPTFHHLSVCDKQGRLFFYKNRVYRGIFKDHENQVQALIKSDFFKTLMHENWFVKTSISNKKVAGFNLVLKHERLLASHQTEWSFSMLKEAVIFLLKLQRFLNTQGYQLLDGHLYNVLFKNNFPIFVDLGSVIPIKEKTHFYDEVLYLAIYPLILYAMNERFLASSILSYHNYMRTIPMQNIEHSELVQIKMEAFFKKHHLPFDLKLLYEPAFLEKFITPPFKEDTLWGGYQSDFYHGQNLERFKRYEIIASYIDKYVPEKRPSICDLAGNQGAMLYYLEQKRIRNFKLMTNVDYDENAIELSLIELRQRGSKVGSYLFNFMLPKRDLYQDFKHDVVLALAVTHHLILSQGFLIDAIFEQVKRYSNQYVFIEFMPLGLWNGKEAPDLPPWYTVDWFEKHFKKYFRLLHKDAYEENRILFIGKVI